MENTPREVLINDITELKGLIDQCKESSGPEVKWIQGLLTNLVNQKHHRLEELATTINLGVESA